MWRSGARRCLPKEQASVSPGTKGAEIVDELAPLPNETVLRKLRFSAFFQTELDMILRRLKNRHPAYRRDAIPQLRPGTATDAMSHDYNTIVVTDACSAQTDEIAATNIRDMKTWASPASRWRNYPPYWPRRPPLRCRKRVPPLGFLAQRGKTAHAHGVTFSDTFFQQELPPRRLPHQSKVFGMRGAFLQKGPFLPSPTFHTQRITHA